MDDRDRPFGLGPARLERRARRALDAAEGQAVAARGGPARRRLSGDGPVGGAEGLAGRRRTGPGTVARMAVRPRCGEFRAARLAAWGPGRIHRRCPWLARRPARRAAHGGRQSCGDARSRLRFVPLPSAQARRGGRAGTRPRISSPAVRPCHEPLAAPALPRDRAWRVGGAEDGAPRTALADPAGRRFRGGGSERRRPVGSTRIGGPARRRFGSDAGSGAGHLRRPRSRLPEVRPARRGIRFSIRVSSLRPPAHSFRPPPSRPQRPSPIVFPLGPAPAPRSLGRWSLSAWAFVRQGDSAALAAGGILGGSQAGARLSYRLNRDLDRPLALSVRLSAPLRRAAGAEAALGVDWKPARRLPLHLLGERRQKLGREGRSAFAATIYGGVDDARLGPFRIDGYGQAGMVGIRSRDPFADGSLRLSLPLGGRARLGGRSLGRRPARRRPSRSRPARRARHPGRRRVGYARR